MRKYILMLCHIKKNVFYFRSLSFDDDDFSKQKQKKMECENLEIVSKQWVFHVAIQCGNGGKIKKKKLKKYQNS